MTARRWRLVSTRSIAVLLGVLMLATIEAWSAAPAHGRDLSGPITAVRAGQIAAEASMRSADKQLKTTEAPDEERGAAPAEGTPAARGRDRPASDSARAGPRCPWPARHGSRRARAAAGCPRRTGIRARPARGRRTRGRFGGAGARRGEREPAGRIAGGASTAATRAHERGPHPAPGLGRRARSGRGAAPELCPPDRAIGAQGGAQDTARETPRAGGAAPGPGASSPASGPRSRSSTAPRRASPATSTR